MATRTRTPSEEANGCWEGTRGAVKRREVFQEKRPAQARKLVADRASRRPLAPVEVNAQRRVPLDMLAREWLNEQRASVDTRAYLVEKLLPTLVIGVEKLLTEVRPVAMPSQSYGLCLGRAGVVFTVT